MSEFGLRTPEALLEDVRASENKVEEAWRERFLAEHLFHDSFSAETAALSPYDGIRYAELERAFLDEKRGKNMGERFELAISDKYLGKIHIVELGNTTNPGVSGEVDGLKAEYRDLLGWMIQEGIVENEIPRQRSDRNVSLRAPALREARDQVQIMVRNRRLVKTTLEHEGGKLSIAIAKRMVFSLPTSTTSALHARFHSATSEQALEFIETTFLHHGSGGVQPIRTSYYLATDFQNS